MEAPREAMNAPDTAGDKIKEENLPSKDKSNAAHGQSGGKHAKQKAFSLHKALDPQMPNHLRELAHQFAALEFALNSCVLYQRVPFFDVLKLSIESSRQSAFTKEHLQMILSVLPDAYTLTEAKQNPKDAHKSLVIRRHKLATTPSEQGDQQMDTEEQQETMSTRIERFAKALNAFVWKQRREIQKEFAGLTSEELESAMDLIEIEKNPLDIQDPPQDQTNSALARHSLTRKRKASDTTMEANIRAPAVHGDPKRQEKPIPKELQSLPKWLVDQVRRREDTLEAITRKKAKCATANILQSLPQLCDQLESLALVQRCNTFELRQLKQKLQMAARKDNLDKQLQLLEALVPKWLSISCFNGQQFVKLNRAQVKFHDTKRELRRAIAQELHQQE